jgi:hypothetical protein
VLRRSRERGGQVRLSARVGLSLLSWRRVHAQGGRGGGGGMRDRVYSGGEREGASEGESVCAIYVHALSRALSERLAAPLSRAPSSVPTPRYESARLSPSFLEPQSQSRLRVAGQFAVK